MSCLYLAVFKMRSYTQRLITDRREVPQNHETSGKVHIPLKLLCMCCFQNHWSSAFQDDIWTRLLIGLCRFDLLGFHDFHCHLTPLSSQLFNEIHFHKQVFNFLRSPLHPGLSIKPFKVVFFLQQNEYLFTVAKNTLGLPAVILMVVSFSQAWG